MPTIRYLNLIELFGFLLTAHVAYPKEKGDEPNDDEQLIKPQPDPGHHGENGFKKFGDKIPESVHREID